MAVSPQILEICGRNLESENTKLKKLLVDAHLVIHALKRVFGVNTSWLKPVVKIQSAQVVNIGLASTKNSLL